MGLIIFELYFSYEHEQREASAWKSMSDRATTVEQRNMAYYFKKTCHSRNYAISAENRTKERNTCIKQALIELHIRATPLLVLDQNIQALGLATPGEK